MKIAYLMTVHKDPLLLRRMIGTLSTADCAFFIHVDRKTSIREFSSIRGDNVFFSEWRIPVYRSEFSQVEATLRLIEQALSFSPEYDYFVLLQGSTYPLRSGCYIHRFLETNRGWEFICLLKMPAPGYPLSKVNKVMYPCKKPVRRFAMRAFAKVGLAQRDYRKYLGALQAYAGKAYWALSREACKYIVEFVAHNPHVGQYFENSNTSDEMYFHTILGNSPFLPRIRRDLVYVDWSQSRGDHPAEINEGHLKFFESRENIWVEDEWGSGEMLFARKFSDDRLDLVDRIDDIIRRNEGGRASSLAETGDVGSKARSG